MKLECAASSFVVASALIFFASLPVAFGLHNPTITMTTSPSPFVSRTIAQVVPATVKGVTRLIGTVDIEGKGTTHPLAEVDPFILLDAGTIGKNHVPPFGAHPHRGHSVVTVLTQGKFSSWDSFSSLEVNEQHRIVAPASYWVDAGTGVFHEEHSIIDNEEDPLQHCKIFQLWVGVKEQDRQKPPKVQYDNNLPKFDCQDGDGKVVGKGVYHVGPQTSITTPHPIVVAHVKQDANTIYNHPVDPTHAGFVVNIQGHATVGGTKPSKENDVLVLASSADGSTSHLEIQSGDEAAEYLVATGEPNKEPWVKKLVANGAIIAATAEEARELAPKIEAMAKTGKEGGSFAPFGITAAEAAEAEKE